MRVRSGGNCCRETKSKGTQKECVDCEIYKDAKQKERKNAAKVRWEERLPQQQPADGGSANNRWSLIEVPSP